MHLAIATASLLKLAPALLLVLPDPAAAEHFERSLEVAPGGRLVVQLERGSIQLDSHPSPRTLRIEARARGFGAASVHFSLERRGGDVVLRSANAEWLRWLTLQPRVVVRAWVPRDLAVKLETRDGGVEARRVAGRLSARTAGSSIRIEEIEGPVELDSSGGRIEAHDLSGSIRARSGGGAVIARFRGAPRGSVTSGGGSIDLSLPRDASLDLDARTLGGRVVVDDAVPIRAPRNAQHLTTAINGGGQILHLRGGGGEIRLRAE
jgi:hypothetical protein